MTRSIGLARGRGEYLSRSFGYVGSLDGTYGIPMGTALPIRYMVVDVFESCDAHSTVNGFPERGQNRSLRLLQRKGVPVERQ